MQYFCWLILPDPSYCYSLLLIYSLYTYIIIIQLFSSVFTLKLLNYIVSCFFCILWYNHFLSTILSHLHTVSCVCFQVHRGGDPAEGQHLQTDADGQRRGYHQRGIAPTAHVRLKTFTFSLLFDLLFPYPSSFLTFSTRCY